MEFLQNCPVCGSEMFDPFITGKDYFLTGESFEIVKCRKCGFRFTNPRPGPTELGKYYESPDYISHSDSRHGLFASVYQKVRKYTLGRKYALIHKYHQKGEILDIGCATGQFLNYMDERGWKVAGIEPDEKARNRAVTEFGLQVFPEKHLDSFKTASFDVITMWHVLEHISDLNSRIEHIKKLLKKDGTFIVAVPNCDAYDAEKYKSHWAGYDLPRHLYHFTKTDMKLLMEKFGFTIVKILPMRFDAFYVSLLSEKYKNGKIRWLPALWSGFWSNLNAGQKNGHSSLIYVIKLK
jgi:SAM-dependent methyltransferase